MTTPYETTRRHCCLLTRLGLVALVVMLAGCFDADALIAARREIAIRAELEEIDLGRFRISLPRPPETVEAAEVHFHAFGQVANCDAQVVLSSLEQNGLELRNRILLATRQMPIQEIEDPSLQSLRDTIVDAVNSQISGEPVQSVGFYEFGFSNL